MKCDDRVHVTRPILYQSSGDGKNYKLGTGSQGILGAMTTENGHVFVDFDRVIGEPCLLVPMDALELDDPGASLGLFYMVVQCEKGKS